MVAQESYSNNDGEDPLYEHMDEYTDQNSSDSFNEEDSDETISQTTNKIIIKGNKKVKKSEIESLMVLKPGMKLDLNLVEQDYIRLMELQYFDDFVISTEEVIKDDGTVDPDGINLVFECIEKPTISRIIFDGNKSIGVGFLIGDITIKNGDFVDKAILVSDIMALEKKYKEKGFNYAKVDYELNQTDALKAKNQVQLIFKIEEGPETFISEIEFIGNERFTASTLKGKMKTKKNIWHPKGTFKQISFMKISYSLLFIGSRLIKADIAKPEINRFTIEDNNTKRIN